MDPNATLRLIQEELEAEDPEDEELAYLVDCLEEWLARGGFMPEWKKYPEASAYFHGEG